MNISIKTKLSLGVGFQFLLMVVSVVVGFIAMNYLMEDTSKILQDNYNTLEYCQQIRVALDEGHNPEAAIAVFEENIEKQRGNVTEPGEAELTSSLLQAFDVFKLHPEDQGNVLHIRQLLNAINKMNMDAIRRKSGIAKETGKTVNVVIGVVGTLSFVLAFILMLNLPRSIADPIKQFVESTKEIAKKNYASRIDERRGDEFGELARAFNSMASKLQSYESSNMAQMLFEKRRMEILINQMDNPVIGLNQLNIVLFANTAALRILDISTEDLVGRSADEVAAEHAIFQSVFSSPTAKDRSTPATSLRIVVDGKERFFEKEVVQVTVPATDQRKEKYIGDVMILQNVTTYKERDVAKTKFIATVSHEFKTPISAIKMSLQLLQNSKIGPLNAEQEALIDSMHDDAHRLLRITAELLEFSQVESGQIQLNIRAVDLQEILDYALSATRSQAEQKRVAVEVGPLPAGMRVMADNEKTAWVLTNLISNAIRYSAEGSKVRVEAQSIEDRLRLAVIDTGPGIAPQYQTKVFERYFRVPGTEQAGSGLGLAISKEFIEAQNGGIGMQSKLGEGSVFWLELLRV